MNKETSFALSRFCFKLYLREFEENLKHLCNFIFAFAIYWNVYITKIPKRYANKTICFNQKKKNQTATYFVDCKNDKIYKFQNCFTFCFMSQKTFLTKSRQLVCILDRNMSSLALSGESKSSMAFNLISNKKLSLFEF